MNKVIYVFGLAVIFGSLVQVYSSLKTLNSALAVHTAKSTQMIARN
jgi:hypothetical protein